MIKLIVDTMPKESCECPFALVDPNQCSLHVCSLSRLRADNDQMICCHLVNDQKCPYLGQFNNKE